MTANRVFVNDDGIIEIQVRGNQTVASVQAMGDKTVKLAEELRAEGKRVMVLDNLLEMGIVPADARGRVVELVRSNEYDKLAMLGSDTLLRFGANLILQATGKGSRVKYFEDRERCITWLKKL
ncbi:MAG TPA: hypothetical protein VLF40_00745 [Candidatus Saccharimonadales bacterium]|nr:hypothetical protein [Candidatus Saccharimonadales bacterium]